jgi:autotransporter family porin
VYVDSWLQYSWFDKSVSGEQLASESYQAKGLTASLEAGYTMKVGEFSGSHGTLNTVHIQPQAQVTWMGVRADEHKEHNGSWVSSDGDDNIQTRLGLRAYLKGHSAQDAGRGRDFQPFIEASWLHNTRHYSALMDGVRISQSGAHNVGELKVGVDGQLTYQVGLWGNVGTQLGDKGYNDTSASVGIRYRF